MKRLTGLAYSPWSEKAKWALDHHQIHYQYREHIPVLGELLLRVRMRNPRGHITVPVLQDGKLWFTDSLDIARYAERIGVGSPLFPEGKGIEIERWNQRGEAILAAGRAMAVLPAAENPETALAVMPPLLRPLLGGLAQKGLESVIAKYRMRDLVEESERVMIETLAKLETALAGRSGYLIDDRFTFADIAMAVAVQFVVPVDSRYMPAAPPGVPGYSNPALAARFQDLVAWRDELYARHRHLPRSR